MVTYPQLKYMVELDKHRHFVTAAESCFVTQPTLSMQIKKLEEQLQVQLFDRSKQPVLPTPIGKKIIQQARIALAENQRIHSIIEEYKGELRGDVRIGIIPSLAAYLLPLFIGKFIKDYTGLNLHIKEMLSEEIIEELRKDNLDIAVLVGPISEIDIIEKQLFYEKILVYVNNSHSYAEKKEIELSQLGPEDMWMLSKGHCFRTQVLNLCSLQQKATAEAGFHYESGSLESLKKFVQLEGGYTLIPELAAIDNDKQTSIVPIENSPLREVCLIHSRNYSKLKIIEVLTKGIKEAVPKKMMDAGRGQVVEWK